MANPKQIANEVLGTINGALAILDKIPKLEESDGNFEFGMTLSPFTLILEVLKNTKGYDYILEWIGGFLVFVLPEVEVALKTLLMLNLKGLITCSLNPIIPNDLLVNGIVFDLKEIDLFNMLSYCPLDKGKGDNYYFGVKAAKVPDDLRRCQDFNAFLWYMVNRSNCREIWNKCKPAETSWVQYISDTTFGSLNESAMGGDKYQLPLKDFSCVDIDLSTVDENGNNQYLKDKYSTEWINAKWKDVFTLVNETGQTTLKSPTNNKIGDTDYKNVKNLFYNNNKNNGFIYLTSGGAIKPIVYIATEDDETDEWYYEDYTFVEDLFDISDNLYDFKVKQCCHYRDRNLDKNTASVIKRNCIYKKTKNFLKVNSGSIEKRDYEYVQNGQLVNGSIRCGIFDKHKWGEEYDLTPLDNCRVTGINDEEYYYCNYLGYVCKKESKTDNDGQISIKLNGNAVKFEKLNATYEIKINFLTGENKNVKVGITSTEKKLKKNAGIITLEYNEDRASVTNAVGGQVTGLSLPYRNCLHVFLGNVQPQNYGDIIKLRNEIRKCEEDKKIAQDNKDSYYKAIEKAKKTYNDNIKNKRKELKKNKISGDDFENELTDYEASENTTFQQTQNRYLYLIFQEDKKISEKDKEISAYESAIYASEKVYRTYKQNYYYRHTLIEFNFDYIWSLKLFDPKVVAAQMIDAIVGLTTINLGLSYERIFLQEEIKRMVSDVIHSDDTEVNDCFFTFSNDKYNSLVIQSEKLRQGLYSTHPNQEGIKLDINAIEDTLNSINSAASKEEQKTAIQGALRDIQGMISPSPTNALETDKISPSFGLDFIENLLTNLATVLAQSFLSPKVYLLIAVNMKIMGEQTDVTIEMLIAKLKNLIVDMIRLIRDQILNYFTEKLMELLKEISINVGTKLAIEQALYYYNLIRKLIDCFKRNKTIGFTVDEVNYADIYAQEPTPPTEC